MNTAEKYFFTTLPQIGIIVVFVVVLVVKISTKILKKQRKKRTVDAVEKTGKNKNLCIDIQTNLIKGDYYNGRN